MDSLSRKINHKVIVSISCLNDNKGKCLADIFSYNGLVGRYKRGLIVHMDLNSSSTTCFWRLVFDAVLLLLHLASCYLVCFYLAYYSRFSKFEGSQEEKKETLKMADMVRNNPNSSNTSCVNTNLQKQQKPFRDFQKAAMPHLFTPMALSAKTPSIHILYLDPTHQLIRPEEVQKVKNSLPTTGKVNSYDGKLDVIRLTSTTVVKFGPQASLIEAKNMRFVRDNTSIPVPKLYAAYAYGPLDRAKSTEYDVYIFMENIEGENLESCWDTLDDEQKETIHGELKGYMDLLRSLPDPGYIGGVDHGPLTELLFESSAADTRGPFTDENDFNTALSCAYEMSKPWISTHSVMHGMLSKYKHAITFTHGDFRPANIMIRDGHVAAIIDWEFSGWYPESWEWARANALFFNGEWQRMLMKILIPYFYEERVYGQLSVVLW